MEASREIDVQDEIVQKNIQTLSFLSHGCTYQWKDMLLPWTSILLNIHRIVMVFGEIRWRGDIPLVERKIEEWILECEVRGVMTHRQQGPVFRNHMQYLLVLSHLILRLVILPPRDHDPSTKPWQEVMLARYSRYNHLREQLDEALALDGMLSSE